MHTMRRARKERDKYRTISLPCYQIKRSAGQSAVASAAYRSGEKLHSEYYGEDSDYTRKGGVICSEILLPPHAPLSFADRQTLWNEVEKAERGKKAQLAFWLKSLQKIRRMMNDKYRESWYNRSNQSCTDSCPFEGGYRNVTGN